MSDDFLLLSSWRRSLSPGIAWTVLFAVLLGFNEAEAAAEPPVTAVFVEQGRLLEVRAPGIESFVSGFSATVECEGVTRELRSTSGEALPVVRTESEKTPYGVASVSVSKMEFPAEKISLEMRVGMIPALPGILLQPVLRNHGTRLLRIVSLTSLDSAKLRLNGSPGDWIATAYDQSFNGDDHFKSTGTLAELQKGLVMREYGSLYRKDGPGFLFGPVGEPQAFLENRISPESDGSVRFGIVSEMSGVRVDPGECRSGQQSILLMEPPRKALVRWSEWVAKTHGSRTAKGALSGWCSWYHLTNKIKGSDVLGVVEAVRNDPAHLRPGVIQIDDGYQDIDGKWDANGKFPEGLPYYAKRIAETGARPGLWMAMTMIGVKHPWLEDPSNREAVWGNKFRKESNFRPDETGWLDPTHPRAKEHIVGRIRHAVESGFSYLKLDFNNIGSGGWFEQKKTSFQILREHYQRMRAAAGENTYILACIVEPNRAVLGSIDAHRISHDAHRGGVRSAINDVLRSYHLNDRWMAVDNDIYYIVPDERKIGNVQGGRNLHRTWLSMMGLSGGAALTSDPWHWNELKSDLRTVEIMQPPAKMRSEVLDLGTATEWPRLASLVKRPWGDRGIILLWNPDKQKQRTVALDFAEAGLDPLRTYAVWSFWDNAFLGTTRGSWTSPRLDGWSCQELVFTPIDGDAAGKPVLIGSNLHISAGVAEVKDVRSEPGDIRIDLNDAGARDGDLFLFSEKPLRVENARGCEIESVSSPAPNIHKVRILKRQPGQEQSIHLKVA